MMKWIKLDSREYHFAIKRGGLPNGLYYRGNPLLLIYESDDFFQIIAFLQLIKYYYAYPEEGEKDIEFFKNSIHNRISIEMLLEYIYSPNGEERVEVQNTTNNTRFPFVWTYENALRVYIPNGKQIWKLQNYIKENPYFFPLLLENMKDWKHFVYKYLEISYFKEEKYINDVPYIYQFEFKWLHFSPNTLLKFSLSLLKIIFLNDCNREQRDVIYSYGLLNPFSYHIYHYYLYNYPHSLSWGEKLSVISLRTFCGIWEIRENWEDIFDYYMEEYMAKYPLWAESLMSTLHIKRYIQKNLPLIFRLIDSLPFTFILYLKYILGVSSVTFFLKYYLGFRLIRIFFRWLFIIWKSFYPRAINEEEEKIFNRYLFPLLVLANLQMLGLCFLLLNKYIPQFQYLGLMLFIILRYIIVEKLIFGGIILKILKRDIEREKEKKTQEEKEEYKLSLPWYKRYNKERIKKLIDYLQF